MPKILFLIFFIFIPQFISAQQNDSLVNNNDFVPFAIIDEVPIYPGCEILDKSLQRFCLQEQIKKYVSKNFDKSVTKNLKLEPGVIRVYVFFKIDEGGDIIEINASATHKELKQEGIRVVNSLPKMIPGKHHNKTVTVKYALPISFTLD